MACRFPGGNTTPDEYWSFLLNKGCGIREVPADRWAVDAFYDENPDTLGKAASKWGGFLDDIRCFDAGFFGISPREADAMDPQQRLLLMTAFEAIQDSRAPLEAYQSAQTGVFVGVSQSDYRALQELRSTNPEAFAGTGYALCINANRISHRLNLSGPSFAVDTACSSSLVALNEGVQSLLSGSCNRAIVGGVNVLAHPSSFVAFSRAGMLSTTGTVSTFDASANGFVRGEGAGVVVLKPYQEALRDRDHVHGVIHATNCNQDGRTSTITAPSQCAQIAVLEGLFERSGLRPDQIGYVEAHGTGTPVGDPIEAGAIGRVIGQTASHGPVFVGSGKANVGHGEPAAGITGLIKAVLSARNKTVAPNINFNDANPSIPFDALNLKVPTKPEPFPEIDGVRAAVVNSFGFGGTNGSALVSAAPEEPEVRRVYPAKRVAA
ncbi:MAG: polyketide synthase, partial [Pseudomonadota bacterium]